MEYIKENVDALTKILIILENIKLGGDAESLCQIYGLDYEAFTEFMASDLYTINKNGAHTVSGDAPEKQHQHIKELYQYMHISMPSDPVDTIEVIIEDWPEEHRALVTDYYIHDMPASDIMQARNMTDTSFNKYLTDARLNLKKYRNTVLKYGINYLRTTDDEVIEDVGFPQELVEMFTDAEIYMMSEVAAHTQKKILTVIGNDSLYMAMVKQALLKCGYYGFFKKKTGKETADDNKTEITENSSSERLSIGQDDYIPADASDMSEDVTDFNQKDAKTYNGTEAILSKDESLSAEAVTGANNYKDTQDRSLKKESQATDKIRKNKEDTISVTSSRDKNLADLYKSLGIETNPPSDIVITMEKIAASWKNGPKYIIKDLYINGRSVEAIAHGKRHLPVERVEADKVKAIELLKFYKNTYLKYGVTYYRAKNDEVIYAINIPVHLKKYLFDAEIYTVRELGNLNEAQIEKIDALDNKDILILQRMMDKFNIPVCMATSLIEFSGLRPKIKERLIDNGIHKLTELTDYTEEQIKNMCNFTHDQMLPIRKALKNRKLSFKEPNYLMVYRNITGKDKPSFDLEDTMEIIIENTKEKQLLRMFYIESSPKEKIIQKLSISEEEFDKIISSFRILLSKLKENYLKNGAWYYISKNDKSIYFTNMSPSLIIALENNGVSLLSDIKEYKRSHLLTSIPLIRDEIGKLDKLMKDAEYEYQPENGDIAVDAMPERLAFLYRKIMPISVTAPYDIKETVYAIINTSWYSEIIYGYYVEGLSFKSVGEKYFKSEDVVKDAIKCFKEYIVTYKDTLLKYGLHEYGHIANISIKKICMDKDEEKILIDNGIGTLEDVSKHTREEISSIKGIGAGTMNELDIAMDKWKWNYREMISE